MDNEDIQLEHEVHQQLETPCEGCNGTGGYDDRGYWCNCLDCRGVGTVLTDAGQRIFDMIERRFKRKD